VGREEGAEQDELPAEGRGGGPHAAAVERVLLLPRARGPAHRFPWEGTRSCWRARRRLDRLSHLFILCKKVCTV
jgi:hypothetical protein